mgnify:CR=1 FL=1
MKGCLGSVWRLTLYGVGAITLLSLLLSGESSSMMLGAVGLLGFGAFYFYKSNASGSSRSKNNGKLGLRRKSARNRRSTGWQNRSIWSHQSYAEQVEEFVEQAKIYQNHDHGPCEFHALHIGAEWIRYDWLTREQLDWYFYWRAQARNGQYLDTSSAYIFLHTYELINDIGVTDVMDGYHQLKMLWVNYKDTHSDVRYRLLDWLIDYSVINSYPENPLDVWNDVPIDKRLVRRYPDMLVQVYQDNKINQIPFSLIDKLIDYRIDKSKFYLNDNQDIMEKSVYEVLDAIDLSLRRSGTGIFQKYQPESFEIVERFAFRQAIYKRDQEHVRLPGIYEWSTHKPLRSFLTPIVKHTENILRKQHNHRGRLRVDELAPEIQLIIEQTLPDNSVAEFLIGDASSTSGAVPIPAKRNQLNATTKDPALPKIEIDYERVSQLSQESDEIFELLNQEKDGFESVQIMPPKISSTIDKPSIQADRKPNAAKISIDHDRVAKLQQDSNDVIKVLLHAENEEINDTIEFIEDNVSRDETNSFAGESSEEVPTMVPMENNKRVADQIDEDDEFSQLVSVMSDMYLDVVRAVLYDNEPLALIRQIAVQNGTMPAVLIETINEHADEHIGDLLIELDPTPQFIDDEYATVIKSLLPEEN